jgi:toxin FitB
MGWLAAQQTASLFTTTILEAELLYGVASLPGGWRRSVLEDAMRRMLSEDFPGRVLTFDRPAAREFAAVASARRSRGRPISALDAQIAAIARANGAAVATRNVADFKGCGIRRAAEPGLWPTCGKRDPRALFASDRAILGCHRAVFCPIPSRLGPACPHMRVAEAPSPIGLRQVTSFLARSGVLRGQHRLDLVDRCRKQLNQL